MNVEKIKPYNYENEDYELRLMLDVEVMKKLTLQYYEDAKLDSRYTRRFWDVLSDLQYCMNEKEYRSFCGKLFSTRTTR